MSSASKKQNRVKDKTAAGVQNKNRKIPDVSLYTKYTANGFAFVFLTVFPLLISGKGYSDITEFKFISFAVIALLMIAALAAVPAAVRAKNKINRTDKEAVSALKSNCRKAGDPGAVLVLYVIWCTVSAIASPYGKETFIGLSRYEGWLSMFLYAVIALCIAVFGEYSDQLVFGMSASAIAVSFIGILQLFGADIIYPEGRTYANSNFISTIGQTDCYSGIASLFIPALIAAYVLMPRCTRFKFDLRLLCIPAVFLMGYTFFYTDVDGGKVGIAAAFAVMFVFMVDSGIHIARFLQIMAALMLSMGFDNGIYAWEGVVDFNFNRKFFLLLIGGVLTAAAGILLEAEGFEIKISPRKIRIAAAALMCIAVIAAFVFAYGYSGGNRMLSEISGILHGNLSDEAGNCRGFIWKKSLEIIKGHSIIGSGPGTFAGEFAPYNEAYCRLHGGSYLVDMAHNDFIHIAVCSGMGGLVIYLIFIILLYARALFGRETENSYAPIILIAGITGYLADVFFVFSIAIYTPLFWVLAGLLIAATRTEKGLDYAAGLPGGIKAEEKN